MLGYRVGNEYNDQEKSAVPEGAAADRTEAGWKFRVRESHGGAEETDEPTLDRKHNHVSLAGCKREKKREICFGGGGVRRGHGGDSGGG
jgi:hypothetical protein